MDSRRLRILLSAVLLLAGAALLTCGFIRNIPVLKGPSADASPVFATEAQRREVTIALRESQIVREVTVAGIVRWPDTQDLQQRYTTTETGERVDATGKKAAQACPT